MFVLNLKLSKRGIAVAILSVALVATLAICILCFLPSLPNGKTAEDREAYIYSLGYRISREDELETEIVIPEEFSKTFEKYNEIQAKAGFDLKEYSGKTALLYSYPLEGFSGEQVYLNLIVCGGRIIGGDVSTLYSDGFALPLIHKNKNSNELEGID